MEPIRAPAPGSDEPIEVEAEKLPPPLLDLALVAAAITRGNRLAYMGDNFADRTQFDEAAEALQRTANRMQKRGHALIAIAVESSDRGYGYGVFGQIAREGLEEAASDDDEEATGGEETSGPGELLTQSEMAALHAPLSEAETTDPGRHGGVRPE